MRLFTTRFIAIMVGVGMISPSITYNANRVVDISILTQSQARAAALSGGGMHRGGSMHIGGGGFRMNRISSPRSNRYYGGSFQRSRPTTTIRKTPKSNFNLKKPTNKSFTKQTKPMLKPSKTSIKPSKAGLNSTLNKKNPAHTKPLHPQKPPHHERPPHHGGSHGHHGHHHHYYPHYGDYWPWFWGSSIVIGAIVSTIPDNDCHDVMIDNKLYKECEGVLFEPVYEGDEVGYKVIKMEER